MSLQDVMTNRRKFLERSALGFGSVLFLPSLLASCTDHRINPTDPTINPPLLGDGSGIDWNNDAKTVVTTALGLIPEVGGILSGLVGIFWPSSGEDVWGQVQTDLEISNEVYNLVKEKLGSLRPSPTGLIYYINNYQQELKNGTPASILNAWSQATGAFAGNQGAFQDANNQVPLLPLFAQFANLYLALLRDGVKYGQSWGRTDSEHNNIDVPALTNAVYTFNSYANGVYNTGLSVVSKKQEDRYNVEPFRSSNTYNRQMTLTVLDYIDSWQYFDITQYPNGAINPDGTPVNLFTREIYSDPIGNLVRTSGSYSPINLPSPATQFPTQITVWAGERLDAVQLTYPAGGGPGGVTITPRMGDKNGGSTNAPAGGTLAIPPGSSIQSASVNYDYIRGGFGSFPPSIINTIQFTILLANGSYTETFGAGGGTQQSGPIGYDNYALSSIYIHGSSEPLPDTSADCIVFGFLRVP